MIRTERFTREPVAGLGAWTPLLPEEHAADAAAEATRLDALAWEAEEQGDAALAAVRRCEADIAREVAAEIAARAELNRRRVAA